jgi:hypothetical protein
MWSARGSAAKIWVSGSGGRATSHEFRPLADQFNERSEHSEANRANSLPLSWSFSARSGGRAEEVLGNIGGNFRRPDRVGGVFVVYEDLVGFTGILDDRALSVAYDALKVFLMNTGPREYVLTSDFAGGRNLKSDAPVPTTEEFFHLGYPYIIEGGPSLAFKFGQPKEASI